jgi:hypothetical protein
LSNIEPQGFYPDEGFEYGARYGGYQATRFNSTLVKDEEAVARANFRYHYILTLLILRLIFRILGLFGLLKANEGPLGTPNQ